MLALQLNGGCGLLASGFRKIEVDAHVWVYASRFPPDWDCTPVLDEAFHEIKIAGFSGIELMESVLLHDGAVARLKELIDKHDIPVTGTSFYGDMWNKDDHGEIMEKMEIVTERLSAAGGKMIGLTVGDAKRKKTDKELDDQAEILQKIIKVCTKNKIAPNMHNHTFEMEYDLFDFKGTVARVPELKLGPDLNWLIRAGIDPVWFINNYGGKMVYMHLRDQHADGKWAEALGEGVTDFKSIASALKKMNYNGRAAVELAFEGATVRPVKESWIASRNYVKKVFGW